MADVDPCAEGDSKALKRKRARASAPDSAEDSSTSVKSAIVFQQCNPDVTSSSPSTSHPRSNSRPPLLKRDLHWLELVNKAALLWDNQLLSKLITERHPGTIVNVEKLLRCKVIQGNSSLSDRYSHPLYVCAKNNNVEGVRLLVETGECSVDFTNRLGISPLYISCHYGNAAVVDLLCRHGARFDLAKKQGGTCVNTAVKHGCLDALKALAKHGAGVGTALHRGESFLHVASRYGHADIVQYLLDEHGVDINVRSSLHTTAVQVACAYEKTDVVCVLLQRGCAVLQDVTSVDRCEIHMAARSGNFDLLAQVVKGLEGRTEVPDGWINLRTSDNAMTPFLAGVDGKADESCLRLLYAKGADPLAKDIAGFNAVVLATRYEREHLLGFLDRLCGRAMLREETDGGYNALEMACRHQNLEAVKTLLAMDSKLLETRPDSHSALYLAARVNHLGLVKLLVETYGVNVNETRPSDTTPVQVACKGGYVEVVKYLLEHGASLDAQGHPNIAFISACNHDRLQVVKYLVERKGCEIALTRGGAGWTGIHVASRSGNMELLRFLCETLRGHEDIASMVENGGGYTALHVAAYHGQLDVVRYLCADVGMPVTAKSVAKGHTALYLATRRGQEHVVEWLRRAEKWSRFDLYVESRNHSMAYRLLNEGTAGTSPFAPVLTHEGGAENAMDIAKRGPGDGEEPGPRLPICEQTLKVVRLGMQAWCPQNHMLYPPWTRERIVTTLLALRAATSLPLPIQRVVCSFLADRSPP